MIRSDDPFKRIPPASFQPPAQPATGTGKPPETAPAAPSGASTPATAPSTEPKDTKNVRDLSEHQPFDPEQGLTFPKSNPGPKPIPVLNNNLDLDVHETHPTDEVHHKIDLDGVNMAAGFMRALKSAEKGLSVPVHFALEASGLSEEQLKHALRLAAQALDSQT